MNDVTIGVLGAGQLGRMLALAGYPLGLRFRFLDPASQAPAGHLADHDVAAFDDRARLEKFAAGLRLITYEFENVPIDTARFLAERAPVYPAPQALQAAQDRLTEKTLLHHLGIPVAKFAAVDSRDDLLAAVETLGLPAVLKTRRLGYDGKGQIVLREPGDALRAWDEMQSVPLILEEFIPFEREVSLLAVRGQSGETAFYPLVENHHAAGILRQSLAPAPGLTDELQAEAEDYAARLLQTLDYTGVLTIEFFVQEGGLVANEIAPRVHNSGHWTIEGAETSQFENHLRAILGLPLGSTHCVGLSVMLNLIGHIPLPESVLAVPGAHLHLYGKAPRPGRKVGHITLCGENADALEARLEQLRLLVASPGTAPTDRA